MATTADNTVMMPRPTQIGVTMQSTRVHAGSPVVCRTYDAANPREHSAPQTIVMQAAIQFNALPRRTASTAAKKEVIPRPTHIGVMMQSTRAHTGFPSTRRTYATGNPREHSAPHTIATQTAIQFNAPFISFLKFWQKMSDLVFF
jgi:hypothetical protein